MKKPQKRWTSREEIIAKIDSLIDSVSENLAMAMREDTIGNELRSEIGRLSKQEYSPEIQMKINGLVLEAEECRQKAIVFSKRRVRIEQVTLPKFKTLLAEFDTRLLAITNDPAVVLH